MAPKEKPVTVDPVPVYPQIIVALFLLGGNRFHWIISVQDTTASQANPATGMKLHATNVSNKWEFEARGEYSLDQSAAVCVAAVIGELKHEKGFTAEKLKDLLALIPMAVPAVDQGKEPVFSCRVWMKEALRRMHAAHFIDCPDVDALEAEMIELGVAAERSIDEGKFTKAKFLKVKNSK